MPTPYSDVALLLRRAGFGGTPNEISALAQLDLSQIVDTLLDTSGAPPVVMPAKAANTSLGTYERWVSFLQWWCDRMATTPAPLVEKMTLFWHGHFTSSLDKTSLENMWDQNQLFRRQGLGSFLDLAQAVAIDPAMLEYLDNRTNVTGRPNENFARELMELYTLGVNQYTQADVVASARAWTGHGSTTDRRSYLFTPARHDYGNKTFLGTTKNWDGPDILVEICTGSKKEVSARFIAKKLWSYFAYENPSTALLDELTNAFLASNLNIASQLRKMFLHPEFYSTASREGRVRNPTEYLVATMRYTGLPASATHPEWYLEPAGQRLWYPPNVAGWRGGSSWISTSSMFSRGKYARDITWIARDAGFLGGTGSLSVQTAVQRAFDAFGIDLPSPTSRAAMETAVTAERTARGWGEQVNLITLAMLTPEFQMG